MASRISTFVHQHHVNSRLWITNLEWRWDVNCLLSVSESLYETQYDCDSTVHISKVYWLRLVLDMYIAQTLVKWFYLGQELLVSSWDILIETNYF